MTAPGFNPSSATSRDASIHNIPNRPRDRDRVLAALTVAGEEGLTDFELADVLSATGPHIGQTSAGKRRKDLEDMGVVAKRLVIAFDDDGSPSLIPDRRPSPYKASAGVYVLAQWSEPKQL